MLITPQFSSHLPDSVRFLRRYNFTFFPTFCDYGNRNYLSILFVLFPLFSVHPLFSQCGFRFFPLGSPEKRASALNKGSPFVHGSQTPQWTCARAPVHLPLLVPLGGDSNLPIYSCFPDRCFAFLSLEFPSLFPLPRSSVSLPFLPSPAP